MDLYKKIEDMRARPAMYLGALSIVRLRSFLNGYQMALCDFNLKENAHDMLLPLPFWFFHEYVAHRFDYYESTSGWCNMILNQTGHDEEKGLQLFYALFDEFKQLEVSQCFDAKLNNSNITHHLSDKSAPRMVTGKYLEIEEPLYKNPERVSYAELQNRNHKSYICIIHTKTESIFERKLYKSEKDLLSYFKNCFGKISWQEQNPKDIKLNKTVSV